MNMMTAANEYANRPKDERFPSLEALVARAENDRRHSAERNYNLRDLKAGVQGVDGTHPGGQEVVLQTPRGVGHFTHWSFGQLARTVGAPASYLRELRPDLAADCLNWGFNQAPVGSTASILAQMGDDGSVKVRAATSDKYARVWDSALFGAIAQQFGADAKWTLPPTWDGEPAGAYRGDRDSFLILVNGNSIVSDPSAGSDGSMGRAIMVRNSEVGGAGIWFEDVLYRYICGNHIIWGAVIEKTYRRRHVGVNTLRDVMREVSSRAYKFASQSAARDEAIIRGLISHELASTPEAVIDELRKIGAGKEQAEAAVKACEEFEKASPRSFWGLAQGFTRISQTSGFQDERFALDQLAGKLLKRGALLVAA